MKNDKLTLKSVRALRGYTQVEAAKLIGISPDTLSNYECGKSYPDIPILKKIEEVYQISYFFSLKLRFNRIGRARAEEV